MDQALEEARLCQNEVPIGAIIVYNDQIIAKTSNLTFNTKDPLAHAEILAIKQAINYLNSLYLQECDMYVTLEPCMMCASAISLARIRNLYFGAYDMKGGGVENGPQIYNYAIHKPNVVGGLREAECIFLLKEFFKTRRKKLK